MPRTLARLTTTAVSALLLLVAGAVPAFAASAATKPEAGSALIGSMEALGTAAIVGIAIGIVAYVLMDRDTAPADDHH